MGEEDYIRRYFIMDTTLVSPEDVMSALQMCIGIPETQRWSLDDSKLLIKTNQSEINNMLLAYPQYTLEQIMELTHCTEYTYEQILVVLQGVEWQNQEIF